MTDQGAFWEPVERAPRGVILPSATPEWSTPQWLFDALDRELRFTLDVAASAELHRCDRYVTREQDGLTVPWVGEHVWCNPPYDVDALTAFSRRAYEQTREPGTLAALLVPVKSDQLWWHEYALRSEVRFIRGRVRFGGAPNCAAFPVCVCVYERGRLPRMTSLQTPQRELEINT